MEKIEYPKWKYHFIKEAVIVGSKEDEASLGAEWVDSPADAKCDSIKIDPPKMEKASKKSKSLEGSKA